MVRIAYIKEFYEILKSFNLQPNEYFYMKFKDESNRTSEMEQSLIKRGWLDFDGDLSAKAIGSRIFDDEEDIIVSSDPYMSKIQEYRTIFPGITLGSGKQARSSPNELKKRFDWFFKEYSYTWDEVFTATNNYVKFFEERKYNFMQTSAYFIKKSEGKTISSSLSEWCEKARDPEIDEKSYDIDI